MGGQRGDGPSHQEPTLVQSADHRFPRPADISKRSARLPLSSITPTEKETMGEQKLAEQNIGNNSQTSGQPLSRPKARREWMAPASAKPATDRIESAPTILPRIGTGEAFMDVRSKMTATD